MFKVINNEKFLIEKKLILIFFLSKYTRNYNFGRNTLKKLI
jgi:hypothetical protein